MRGVRIGAFDYPREPEARYGVSGERLYALHVRARGELCDR